MAKAKVNKQTRLTPKERSAITVWMDKNRDSCLESSRWEYIRDDIEAALKIKASINAIVDIGDSLDIKLSSKGVPPPNFWVEIQKLKDNDAESKAEVAELKAEVAELKAALCIPSHTKEGK